VTLGEIVLDAAAISFVVSALLAMYALAKGCALYVIAGRGRNQKREEAKLLFIYAGGWAIIMGVTGAIYWRG